MTAICMILAGVIFVILYVIAGIMEAQDGQIRRLERLEESDRERIRKLEQQVIDLLYGAGKE